MSNPTSGDFAEHGNPEHSLCVDEEHARQRLDRFLTEVSELTRNQAAKLINDGRVLVNGVPPSKVGQKIRVGDIVAWSRPEPVSWDMKPEDIPLSIVYEDSDLIVVDKAAGMVVHPAVGNLTGTLANALLHHCADLQGIGGVIRPGIVHRIDKDTSGLLVVAKNEKAHNQLSAQFADHSIDRTYKALVFGIPTANEATIDRNIARNSKDRKRFAAVEHGGKRAVTHYRTLFTFDEVSLLELRLETGRTHQIRVHMNHYNHPLVGDPSYCNPRRVSHLRDKQLHDRLKGVKRQMLHAASLGFEHPSSGERLHFEAPLAPDMAELVGWLERRSETQWPPNS